MATDDRSRTLSWWFGAVVVPGGFVVAFWPTIQLLVRQWIHAPDYSHGVLVPPVALYLAWRRRFQLKEVEIAPDWRALPVMLLAVGVFIVGELGAELFTTRLSMLVLVFGLTWFLCGFQIVRALRFPLAFLLLMLPLPGFVYRSITFPLQLLSSAASVDLLQSLGITVFREGNVIDMGITRLQVAEACNGLRYILPLLTFGVLVAYFGQKTLWKRIVLVCATLPIAVVGNIFRIGGTAFIATRWGSKAAEGFFHSFSGWLVFMFCAGLFLLLKLGLHHLPGAPRRREARPPRTNRPVRRSLTWPSLLTALGVILVARPAVAHLGKVPPLPLRKPLAAFPLYFDGWSGTRLVMDEKIWKQVGGQDYVMIDYARDGRESLNFYMAYYETQRKAGKFVHSPRLCLPGSGWFVSRDRVRQITGAGGHQGNPRVLKLNELLITKPGRRELAYFWYQGRGRNFTSEWEAKFFMVWDGIWRRRTDGALVRLIMPLGPQQSVEDARRTLDPFAVNVSRKLDEFLP